MPMQMPEIIVESIIRDGFRNARNDPEVINDVFGALTKSYASQKYGEKEVAKILKTIQNKEVSLIHSGHITEAQIPAITLQLGSDQEDRGKTTLGDFQSYQHIEIEDPDALGDLVIVTAFAPTAYDTRTGAVTVPDSVNLTFVHFNHIFVDAAGTEHSILGGIVNETGKKQFLIAKSAEVDLGAGAEIKSSINYKKYKQKMTVEACTILIGIHTQEPLLTKYLYTLIKYFLLSRKADMHTRGLELSSYSGSDFTRDAGYQADQVFTRFLTLTALLYPTYRTDRVALVDNVEVELTVEKDKYGNDVLGLTNSTLKVTE